MIKEQIRAALRNEKGKKAVEAYLVELKKKAKITVNDAVLPKV
jgi:competence CoiA-like predicted nuclease